MSDATKKCRECYDIFPAIEVATYDVVRDDGEYPGTDLCAGCLDDYENADDVVSIWPTAQMDTLRQDIATAVDVGKHEHWQPWLYHAALYEALTSAPDNMTVGEFRQMVLDAGGVVIAPAS